MASRKLAHVIRLGDAIELSQAIKPGSVDCIVTDPPYGSDNESHSSTTVSGKQHARKIANDATPEQAIKTFESVMASLLPKTAPDCDMYFFTSYQVLRYWLALVEDAGSATRQAGFRYKGILVWEKVGPGMGDRDSWGMSHEYVIFLKKGRKERFSPRRSGVISCPQIPAGQLIHPHEKPEGLLEMFIRHSTESGDVVVDPFGGSGATVRAARNCGRSGLAFEIDEYNYRQAVLKLETTEGVFA